MSKHKIMKSLDSSKLMQTAEDFRQTFSQKQSKWFFIKAGSLFLCLIMIVCAGLTLTRLNVRASEDGDMISLVPVPMAATAAKKEVITIPTGIVKANPFVPYRKLASDADVSAELVNDIPKFDLISPPSDIPGNTDAANILTTAVSGILYDKYSPSAILNIDGSDYLVKKGDTVNKYKVMAIAKDSVTVKYGNNTYTAGIGEILTEGSVNYNNVSNLHNKFGGEK